MARVQLAMTDGKPGFAKLIVVKELKRELLDDAEFVRMFHDEARVSARLSHPNIVQTYDVIETSARLALLMEYVEGLSLAAILKSVGRERFPLPLFVRVVSDVLAGLHYAHELSDYDGLPMNVVHRDVSPHNVMVDYTGHVKLLDFGIAKARGALSQTAEGVVKGKIAYMAPESLYGATADRRTDIYSVGVMLWEGITGQRAGGGRADAEIVAMRLVGSEPTAASINPAAPPLLLRACEQALAAAPSERYQTAEQLRDVLELYLAEVLPDGSRAELARFMVSHFADKRERVRKIIADSAAVPTKSPDALPAISDESSHSTPHTRGAVHTQSVPAGEQATPRPSRAGRIATGALAVLGLGATGLYLLKQAQREGVPASTATPAGSAVIESTRMSAVAQATSAVAVGSLAAASGPAASSVEAPTSATGADALALTSRGGPQIPTARSIKPELTAPPAPSSPSARGAGEVVPTARTPRPIDVADPYAK